ncbi:MAG: M61 family metallopeptidase [Acidobacteria bacterium]|nr:M61 family metallopeptidase [Acidobacteriota bacterium]
MIDRIRAAAVAAALVAATSAAGAQPVSIFVDASEAPRKIFHARLTVPVAAGPVTLLYPKWLPGEHGPTGPISDLAGVKISAGGKEIAWRRDSVNMYAFHLDVPAGVASIDVAIDFLSPAATSGFSSGASASSQLALLSWNQLLVYPEGAKGDEIPYTASLRIPSGWKFATALGAGKESAGTIEFPTVPLTSLIDSPVLMGAHFRVYPLGDDLGAAHELDVAAEDEADLEMPETWKAGTKGLVAETGALFGARHYRHYNFLLTLSDQVAHFGLEHHESSDDRVHERTFLDDEPRLIHTGLLPHEMVHSWNGKYRRPAGLKPGSLDQPMEGDLLWVYEGLTQYLGHILTARSGFLTPEQYRDSLAIVAADLDHRAGRQWRPLADTAVAAQILYGTGGAWTTWRRGVDFYDESDLIWMEADTIIRERTKGAKSMDDFCKRFHGAAGGPPAVKPYNFDDVVATLNDVTPYDWKGFLRSRLDSTGLKAPLGGLEAAGWRVVYTDAISERLGAIEKLDEIVALDDSLGMTLKKGDGSVVDVVPGLPAYAAGMGPGMKIVAVNGRKFSKDVVKEAVAATKTSTSPLDLLVENGEYFKTFSIDYHGGARYPHLEAIPGKPDVLGDIIKPHAARPAGASK